MAEIDVSDLSRETLTNAPFPAQRAESFRVFLVERVHEGIWKHASEDMSVEICGVMVGSWAKDADGPFAQVTEYIRCDNATRKFAEVTFTHESWAQINGEMDTKYQDLRIIGWYHSHPNFGIFLSDRDCFIQEHFFSGPGQVALVVDPVRKSEGIFEWRRGKPTPVDHFWVGNRMKLGETKPQPAAQNESHGNVTQSAPHAPGQGMNDAAMSGPLVLVLAFLMLLVGYLYGGRQTDWEQLRLIEGTIAHYGIWKGYKPGFEEQMAVIVDAQSKAARQIQTLAAKHVAVATDDKEEIEKLWKESQGILAESISALKFVSKRYGMTDAEKSQMQRLIFERTQEVGEQRPGSAHSSDNKADVEIPERKQSDKEVKEAKTKTESKAEKSGASKSEKSEVKK